MTWQYYRRRKDAAVWTTLLKDIIATWRHERNHIRKKLNLPLGRFPFDQIFRCEFPKIFWVEWNWIFPVDCTRVGEDEPYFSSLGIFQWLRCLNRKYRSKHNTDMSTMWLFIHNISRNQYTNHNGSKNGGKAKGLMNAPWLCTRNKSSHIVLANLSKTNGGIFIIGRN